MKKSMLGIDIETGSIKLVTKDQCVLIDTAENVFENDHFIAFDGMSEIFKTAVKEHGIRNKKVSLILPDEDLYFSRTTLPLMSEKQLKVNLPYEFSKIVGKDADQYIYDYSLISRNDHEMDLLDVKEAKMRSMKSYIEEHSDANQGEVAVYNNLSNEIDALANILQPTASNVSIQWAEPYLTDTIVRRNADITCTVPSYVIAESVIDQIVNLQYKCIISSLSISGSDTMSVNTSESVSISMTVTFFETIDGAVNINGLTEAQ